MFFQANHCPGCGYGPIPPLTDNCPMCAHPVHSASEGSGGGSLLPPGKVACLVGILVLHAYLFFDMGLIPTVVLCMPPCFAFAIATSQQARPGFRLLAGSFLVLAMVGLWFASRQVYPNLAGMHSHLPLQVLQQPGLKEKLPYPYRSLLWDKMIVPSFLGAGGPYFWPRLGARMLFWYVGMYLLYGVVLLPPYLFLTALRQRRRPWFSPTTCWVGLAVWLLLLAGLGTQVPKFPAWLGPREGHLRPEMQIEFGPNPDPRIKPEAEPEID